MTSEMILELILAVAGVVVSVLGTLSLHIFSRISKDLDKLIGSVDELNVKIAVVVSKVDSHETRLNRIEQIRE